MNTLYIILGSICVGVGIIGIIIPGLPTTPFLLLGAACYLRGSPRLYERLLANPILGKHIRNFREKRGITKPIKIGSILLMWSMIGLSIFLLQRMAATLILIAAGIIGTIVMGFLIRTIKE